MMSELRSEWAILPGRTARGESWHRRSIKGSIHCATCGRDSSKRCLFEYGVTTKDAENPIWDKSAYCNVKCLPTKLRSRFRNQSRYRVDPEVGHRRERWRKELKAIRMSIVARYESLHRTWGAISLIAKELGRSRQAIHHTLAAHYGKGKIPVNHNRKDKP